MEAFLGNENYTTKTHCINTYVCIYLIPNCAIENHRKGHLFGVHAIKGTCFHFACLLPFCWMFSFFLFFCWRIHCYREKLKPIFRTAFSVYDEIIVDVYVFVCLFVCDCDISHQLIKIANIRSSIIVSLQLVAHCKSQIVCIVFSSESFSALRHRHHRVPTIPHPVQ